jgi:hypothetical protein
VRYLVATAKPIAGRHRVLHRILSRVRVVVSALVTSNRSDVYDVQFCSLVTSYMLQSCIENVSRYYTIFMIEREDIPVNPFC